MNGLAITAVGVASGQAATGLPALAEIARWPNAPAPTGGGDPAAATRALMALRRKTGLRYLDPVVERGVRAIEAADSDRGDSAALDGDPEQALRTGILMVTRLGPTNTREQLYKSLNERQGKGVSATLFSSCGFNIASAVMAKVRAIRGPSLTFAAAPRWGGRVLRFAEGLFARGTVDRLFLSYADGDAAIVLRAEPWERVEERAVPRVLRLVEGLGRAVRNSGRACLALGAEGDLARAGESDGSGRDWRPVPLRIPAHSPGLAVDPTFLSLAWLWETQLVERAARLEVAVADGVVIAPGADFPEQFAREGAAP
jgi:hypothetical protein